MAKHKPRGNVEKFLMPVIEGQIKSYMHDHPEANISPKAVDGIRKRIIGYVLAHLPRLEEAIQKDKE